MQAFATFIKQNIAWRQGDFVSPSQHIFDKDRPRLRRFRVYMENKADNVCLYSVGMHEKLRLVAVHSKAIGLVSNERNSSPFF
jgi:hypothetical protein